MDPDLKVRMQRVIRDLGSMPQGVVHIAGSKGKGTTAYLLAALLQIAGFKVGLFTSPAILDDTELIQVNGIPIDSSRLKSLYEAIEDLEPSLSPFEKISCAALIFFSEQKVDYTILECGYGGDRDATNVVDEKALCILSSVELEHTDVLGKDIETITQEKLGICRPHVPLLFERDLNPLSMPILNNFCIQNKVPSLQADSFELGDHHPHAVGLSFKAFEILGHSLPKEHLSYLEQLQIPGRMEKIRFKNHWIILEGAHTPKSVAYAKDRIESWAKMNNLSVQYRVHFLADKTPGLWLQFPDSTWIDLNDERAGTPPPNLPKKTTSEVLKSLPELPPNVATAFVGSFKLVAEVKRGLSF